MKIKMKVKNIILAIMGIVLFIFIIVPYVNLSFAHKLRYSKAEISEKLYEINARYPSRFKKDESLYNLSENIMNEFKRNIIFMSSWGVGKPLYYNEVIAAIENYEKILKDYPKSKFYESAYRKILDCYILLGDVKKLESWIELGKVDHSLEVGQISRIYNAYNHFVDRDYSEAEKILDNIIDLEDEELKYIYYSLRAHIALMKKDFDKALEFYEEAGDSGWKYRTNLFGSSLTKDGTFWLERADYNNGKNKIKGRVMVENTPIPFVPIFLQYPNEGSSSLGGNFIGITDKNGYFETIGIKDGEYNIGIAIGNHFINDKVFLKVTDYTLNLSSNREYNFDFTSPMKVIKPSLVEIVKQDKFTVEWEEIEGADYYTIGTIFFEPLKSGTGYSSVSYTIQYEENEMYIKDTKITLDLKTLNNQSGPTMWTDEGSLGNPEAILGYFHPGSEMPILVNAFDKDGNLLSSSITSTVYYENLPSVKIEYGELTEGEKIILNMDYKNALKFYEEKLIQNPEDEEALKYLSKIHMVDWEKNKRNFNKAMIYSEKYYEITGDKTFINRVLEYKKIYK